MICIECWGEGIIITCWDDICVGGNHCIHGDGETICPECGGWGLTFKVVDIENDDTEEDPLVQAAAL